MYPSPFEYAAPASLDEALSLLQQHGDEAKLLAGGHSLLPLMKLRLAAPSVLVDLGRIPDLAGIRRQNGTVELGAMTTYAEVLSSADLRRVCPLLVKATEHIGDVQVRNRGTVGGSAAHADPAGDMPAALLALDASFVLTGPNGERDVKADEFFQGPFTTALAPDEILARITIPTPPPGTGVAYVKVRNPASGYAIVGVAAVLSVDGGRISNARIGITGAGSTPMRASSTEDTLRDSAIDDVVIASAADLAADNLDVIGDMHGSVEYRTHLTRVYTRRAIEAALAAAT